MERYVFNNCAFLGTGARNCLPEELKKRDYHKVLLVSDENIIKSGVLEKISYLLEENNVKYMVFSNIKPNPTVENVQNGLKVFKKFKPNVIVAVGGGSVIDCAKAISVIASNKQHQDVLSLAGTVNTKNKAFPLIAMPTTSGTAAEVTINYVITDEKTKRKLVCVDPNDVPIMSIVDSELMRTMPPSLTASTGMDALTHAIESLITKGATDMSDMFALEAIKMIAKYLERACIDGNDMEAREKMAYAQYVVGMGFSAVGLGIVHSMAHALGGRKDIAHGTANAILLPTVMQYNAQSPSKRKYRLIAECFGVDTRDKTDDECVKIAVREVKKLSKHVGIPKSLGEVGVVEGDIELLSQDAFVDICTGGNPRETSVEDIKKLYKSLI